MLSQLTTRIFVFFSLFLLLGTPAQANTSWDYEEFGRIPILHEGRIKPLDSFARIQLQALHGKDTLYDQPAIAWLAQSLFAPHTIIGESFIRLPNPRLVSMLELSTKNLQVAHFSELLAAFENQKKTVMALLLKDNNTLTKHERDYVALYKAINSFAHITHAMSMISPYHGEVPSAYLEIMKIEENQPVHYLDLAKIKDKITNDATRIVEQKGDDIAGYTEKEQQIAALAFHIASIEEAAAYNSLFKIIPAFLDTPHEWYAPWALVNEGHGSPKGAELLEKWNQLSHAYQTKNHDQWNTLSQEIREATQQARETRDWQLDLEIIHNQLNPIKLATTGYVLAFLLLIAALSTKRLSITPGRIILRTSIAIHLALIIARILILDRPPVSTLYESVIFVSLICAMLGTWIDKKTGKGEGKIIGSFLAAFLLLISHLYAGEGDTLGVLIAVLNTNFWLATHVICITIGYGCCLVAGGLSHIYLYAPSQTLDKHLTLAALIALLFTAIGTMLGGIWADQSWGRFWGWDPKENGALFIVLWLVWCLHGKMTPYMQSIGFAALLAGVNIVVALSWFGVNLLNVGLHSYGFTDAAAIGLVVFCSIELLLIGGLYLRARKKRYHLERHA